MCPGSRGSTEFLRKVAVNAQVVVITCRPQDYLAGIEVSAEPPLVDLAGGMLRAIDLGRVLQRRAAPTEGRAEASGTGSPGLRENALHGAVMHASPDATVPSVPGGDADRGAPPVNACA